MKRLLVGYDGSEPAREAARMAGHLAAKLHAKLTVLTVGQLFTAADTMAAPIVDERVFLPVAEEGAQIARALGADADADGRVLFGEPGQMLGDVAARQGYDMVVVGHGGLRGIKGSVLGSAAKKVSTEAPCPVLVVRGTVPEAIKIVH